MDEASDEKRLAKTIACYGRVDLLRINELGYMELDKRDAELLFQVLTEREEKASFAIASNESFDGWAKTFGGNIIEPSADSYRLAQAQQRNGPGSGRHPGLSWN